MTPAGTASPAYLVYQYFWCALDWLFPPSCGGCNRTGVRWCDDCQAKINRVTGPVCARCGEPEVNGQVCQSCLTHPPVYEAVRSYAIFGGPIREALHQLKYQRNVGLGDPLSKHLIELYNQVDWKIDLVAPVPLSTQRIRERGYNQAGIMGRPLAYAIRKSYKPNALHRRRNTHTQVGLSSHERQQNVEGAFQANPLHVKGKSILVIDDVTTTGSTINACAQALREAGASAVFGLTLARAVLQADADNQPKPSFKIGGNNGSRGRDLS